MDDKSSPRTPDSNVPANNTNNGLPETGPASVPYVSPKQGMTRRNKALIIGGAVAVVVLGVVGYVFGYHIPNKPENVYARSLSNTNKGYDKLLEYATDEKLGKKFEQNETKGSLKVNYQGTSFDGSFTAKADANNGTFSGDIGAGGSRIKLEGMAKDSKNSEYPDVFVKVSGLKGLGTEEMSFDGIDNKWVLIDHSLFDTIAKQRDQSAEAKEAKDAMPKQADVVDAAKAVGEVNKQYLFTNAKDKAVLEMRQIVGKETVDGKSTYHYKVRANKEHLKTYTREVGKALDKSKLNQWAKDNHGKNLSELMDTEGALRAIDKSENKDFDMWANTKTKMIHKVRFNQSDTKNFLEMGLNYNGGDEYPFFMNTTTVYGTGKLGFMLNTKTNAVKFDLNLKGEGEGAVEAKLDVGVKANTGNVSVNAPSDTITLAEAMDEVGMGDYYEFIMQSLSSGGALGPLGPLNPMGAMGAGTGMSQLDSYTITQ